MARGDTTAQAGETQGLAQSGTLGSQFGQVYGQLAPQLESTAANPQGYNPSDLATMRTQAEEGAGGSNAGTAGQLGLAAARTNNIGALGSAISESGRRAGRQLGSEQQGIDTGNAKLKANEQSQALGELGSLYSTGVSGSNNALGEVANNSNANTNAANASWDWAKDILDPAMASGASAAAAFA